jgi:hypothetical protein
MQYHPLTAALSAVSAELSSPQAKRYYSLRAQQDFQAALVLIIQFGCFAYALGAQFREWTEDVNVTDSGDIAQPIVHGALVLAQSAAVVAPMIPVRIVAIATVQPKALTAFTPVALLTPTPKVKKPRKPATPKPPKAPKAKTKTSKADALMQIRNSGKAFL